MKALMLLFLWKTGILQEKGFTIKIILKDVFQRLVDEVHAAQSLQEQENTDTQMKVLLYTINSLVCIIY